MIGTRARLAVTLMVAAALAGCLSSEDAPNSSENESTGPVAILASPNVDVGGTDGMRFLAIGDQGTGGEAQYRVADTMERVCAALGCDFVLALGDNIYEVGTNDVYDEQFETKFELPYANFSIPFYMVQGNHDNSMDPVSATLPIPDLGLGHWYQTGNTEVDYHYRTDRTSEKWQMPSRYYDFAEGPITVLAMDTNLQMFYGLGATTELQDAPLPGEQRAWIEDALDRADTPWRIAIGHHAYLSNGAHGNAGQYDGLAPTPAAGQYVQETYEDYLCGNVDFFLNGHDHDMQWLEATDDCATEQIISGAAGKTRSLRADQNAAHFQQYDTHGFLWVEVTDDRFTGAFYDVDGKLLFDRTLTK